MKAISTTTSSFVTASMAVTTSVVMVFAAQGTRPLDFINSTLVSAELVKTLVGSFGLVLVAPFTALMSAIFLEKPDA